MAVRAVPSMLKPAGGGSSEVRINSATRLRAPASTSCGRSEKYPTSPPAARAIAG